MTILDRIKRMLKKSGKYDQSEIQDDAVDNIRNWYKDRYESALIQRNIILILFILSVIAIICTMITLRYIRNTKSIEPIAIEIGDRTGIPTIVEPVSVKAYSANEAVLRYFIMKYVRAREEYFFLTFDYNFNSVVRALSNDAVYNRDYRPKYSKNNPNSPVNLYGANTSLELTLKSLIFTSENTAQVRFVLNRINAGGSDLDSNPIHKIALVQFAFQNLKMNPDERLINPLGFVVTLYRTDNENVE